MANKFKDKIVLVTGASRGIGKATALEYGKEGATVIVNFREEQHKAEEVVKQIESNGGTAIAHQADVSQEDQVQKMVDFIIEKFGRIDILINNAGIVIDKPFNERTVKDWEETLAVNLIGPFICSKIVAPLMKAAGYGRIINVSSDNAISSPSPESVDYDATKAGLISLTKNLAMEFAPEVLVNSVAPGWVDTDMNIELPKEMLDEQIERSFLKRMAEPEEIAKPILFLASDDASYITGEVLIINGGII